VLVRDALTRYLGVYVGRGRYVFPEDIEDLAGSRSLELIRRAEYGDWNPEGRSPEEIAGYLAAIARNSLLRLTGKRARERGLPEAWSGGDPVNGNDGRKPEISSPPVQYGAVEAGEFIAALEECVGRLKPGARRVWFFRAFYAMSSRDIAGHPEVGLRPDHVDVVVQRARDALKSCLGAKGFTPREFPAGSFSALWESMNDLSRSFVLPAELEREHAD
jgi:DNA-directed RNA polymerase specialized sigma24 family protein